LSPPAEFDAVALDFAGVMTSPLYEAMGKFSAESGIDLQDLLRACLGAYAGLDDPLVVDFETGLIAEPDFAAALAERLHALSGREVAPEGLVQRLFPVRLEEDMFTAVAAARSAGLRTGLVSNSWGSALYPRARLQAVFDAVVISGEVGFRKPDPAIFRVALERLGVTAERCVFVDDEPAHLTAAAALGFVTVLHHRPETTIAELESLLGVALSGS
jgi:putative hydrolase of the HAD superfamily